jgi:hypothetical protein
MLTAWLANDHACVLAIGPHDRSASDIYDLLLEALGVVGDHEIGRVLITKSAEASGGVRGLVGS